MKHTTDVLVVGGGVIGCSIAYSLSKLGVDCLVVDRGEMGAQASKAAAGLLAPLVSFDNDDFVPFLLANFRLFPSLVAELEVESGLSLDYQTTGSLRTISQPKRVRQLQRHLELWRSRGFDVQWLSGEEARAVEPALSEQVCAAVSAPQEAQLVPSSLVEALVRAARNRKASFWSHRRVTGLSSQGSRVNAVHLAAGERIVCHHLVLATGAWSAMWEQWLGLPLPVQPAKGQAIFLQQPSSPISHILMGEGIYLAPRSGGKVLVGATREDAGFDTRVTQEATMWLRSTAERLVPALASSSLLDVWAGLRPKTPDGKPLLGPVEGWENVVMATGHNAFGIQLSPMTGVAIAELITTGQTPQGIRAFSPSRFQKEVEG